MPVADGSYKILYCAAARISGVFNILCTGKYKKGMVLKWLKA